MHRKVHEMFFGKPSRMSCDTCFTHCTYTLCQMPNLRFLLAAVARMIKFYHLPLLTAGGLSFDYNEPKVANDSEFHNLVKTGYSFSDVAKTIFTFFEM